LKKYFKNKWIIICAIWICSLLLTYWNNETVEEAIELKATYDTLQKNKAFVEANLDKIEKVVKGKEFFSQSVESVQFGFLSMESALNNLSEEYRLTKLKMEYSKKSFLNKNSGSVPVKLFFYGSLVDALNYMKTLEKESPFIRIKTVKTSFEKNSIAPKFELKLTYKYMVSAS